MKPQRSAFSSLLKCCGGLLVSGLLTGAMLAHTVEGFVICTDGEAGPEPLADVTVNLVGDVTGPLVTTTDGTGHFTFFFPDGVTDHFTLSIEPPPGLIIDSPATGNYEFDMSVDAQHFQGDFGLIGCSPLVANCRTTGGGKLLTEHTFPATEFATFGGQVGASLGISTECDPDSELIKGQWEHNRKGEFAANFHASNFDSLMCACFGEGDTEGVTLGGLCNPGDRENGPEPRSAPANKICFSGYGKIAMDGGKKDLFAVFRVDIEDRSEPGGNGKPTEEPADRYRIRIWVLGEGESPDDAGPLALRFAVRCTAASAATTDGADVPLGTAVFGVEAPTIDDGGILDFGNRQLHPPTGLTKNIAEALSAISLQTGKTK